jgi:hypothetical protein
MKKYLYFLLFTIVLTGFSYSQKYVLLDKQMTEPLSYSNSYNTIHSYKNLFPVERENLKQFISELEKLSSKLSDTKKPLPETFNFNVGKTRFFGLRVPNKKENRMDVVLTTDCEGSKISMHISDAKNSNANNAYFINTWIKYIKSSKK